MRTFERFVCWTQSAVNETVVVDAVNSSRAVFLATHRPSQLLRRDFTTAEGGTLIDEEQLLEEFLARHPGLLFMPIIGESGTGKSHLVRWLHLRLPQDNGLQVVYIPKYGTNLRRVIDLILSDMHGEAVDGLRRELNQAVDALDEAGAPSRLLNELAASIEDRGREPRPAPPPVDDEYRQFLELELPKLLLDNVFRSKLLESGGVVDRLVREALAGKQDGDKSAPFAFTIGDLPLSVANAVKANFDVRELFTQLIGSERLRAVAVDLLNENLGPAIRKLFGIGGTRLFDVMLSVRRELFKQGKELVLLIEDFTILQGIQRELLDAITEASHRDGKQVLCSIRVAMAVTTGYFATFANTFSTRAEFAGHVFSLDVPMSKGGRGVAQDDVADFVGGYLNASRLGQERLEEAIANAGQDLETHRQWVPNACHDCPHQDTCHEAFGTTRDGLGLYPFNAPALDRAVESRSPRNFDPRRILGTVVRYTLDQHRANILRGDFPSASFLQHFAAPHLQPLAAEVVEDVWSLDPIDADRRVTLLTFWGDRPNTIVNLQPGIHEAFALPQLDDAELYRPRRHDVGVLSDAGKPSHTLPSKVQRRLRDIDQWAGGTTQLDQALAGDLRRFLHSAVTSHIDWNAELLHPTEDTVGRNGQFFRHASFRIDNALGGGVPPSTAVSFAIPTSAASATLLQAIVQYEHFGHWAFERGDERLRQFLGRLDSWATEVVSVVRSGGTVASNWDPLVGAAELLMFSARVLDLPGSRSNVNADLVSALLADAPGNTPKRGTTWDRLSEACSSDNRRKVRDALLARIGARQGNGRPQAVDVSGLMPAITSFKKTWLLTEPPEYAPKEFRRLYNDVASRLEVSLVDELQRLRSWHRGVVDWLPANTSNEDVANAFASAIELAVSAGVFEPRRLRQPFAETERAFRRTRMSTIREVQDLVASSESLPLGKLIADIAFDRERSISEIDRFVEQTAEILLASTERAQRQIETLSVSGASTTALSSLQSLLTELANSLGGSVE